MSSKYGYIKEKEFARWLYLHCDMTPHSEYPYRYKGQIKTIDEIFDIYSTRK